MAARKNSRKKSRKLHHKTGKKAGDGRLAGLMASASAAFEQTFDRPSMPSRNAFRAVTWTFCIAAVAVAWFLGVPRLERSVVAATSAGPSTVEFEGLPAWVNGDLLAMLEFTAQRQLSGDPFDQFALAAVRDALVNTGWFDDVEQVRRVRLDLVTVRGSFVRPAAVIRDGQGDHLVDTRGRLLPRTYPHHGAQRQLVITGVRFKRPLNPGVQWDGADVTAALRLLRLVDAKPWRDQIERIDASHFLADETLTIKTDLGATIMWGSAPDDERGLEIPADRKIEFLDRAFEEFRRIDTRHKGTLHFYDRGYFAE